MLVRINPVACAFIVIACLANFTCAQVVDVSMLSGANAGEKISAGITSGDCATGCILDATRLSGSQTIASDIFSGVTKLLTLRLSPQQYSVTANVTVPANTTLEFQEGTTLSLSAGTVLNIKGPIIAPATQLFSGTGTVSFLGNQVLDFVYPQWWGAVADDSTDCTSAINAAEVALSTAGKGEMRFVQGIYRTSAPLLKKSSIRWTAYRGKVVIKKMTNTVGSGTRTYANGASDDYAVDSILSIDHANVEPARYIWIEGFQFLGASGTRNTYGIYAPRLASPVIKQVSITSTVTGFITYQSYLGTLEQVEYTDGGATGFKWAVDAAGNSTGTSMHFVNVSCNKATSRCFEIYGLTYSDFSSVAADDITGSAYYFSNSRGISMNGVGAEHITSTVFEVENSNISVSGVYVYEITGQADNTKAVIKLTSGSRVNLNDAHFPAISSPGLISNVLVMSGSSLYVRNTALPTGGSSNLAFDSSSLFVVEDASGTKAQWYDGQNVRTGAILNGQKVILGTAAPTSGTFSQGDMVLNSSPSTGQPWAWVCTAGGTSGTWVAAAFADQPTWSGLTISATSGNPAVSVSSPSNATNQLWLVDTRAYSAPPLPGLLFRGAYNSSGTQTNFSQVNGGKSNATDGSSLGHLTFLVNNGTSLVEGARVDSSGQLRFRAGTSYDAILRHANTASRTYDFPDAGGVTTLKRATVPATATTACVTGEVAWDTNYAYFCVSTDTWRRVAIASW